MSALVGEQDVEATPDMHTMELTVWDVPPTAVAGERFAVSVGAKCSAGCALGGRALSVYDESGSRVGTVTLGHDVWPGTEALYFARIDVCAPLEAGSHQWEAKVAGCEAAAAHTGGSFPLTVRVVPVPDCEITVRAIDRETQTPIAGARVVMHPYRAVTDDNGIAKISVARGAYDILVSRSRYLPACTSTEAGVSASADMITIVALDAEQPWTPPDEDVT
jgi:hypothetical protein